MNPSTTTHGRLLGIFAKEPMEGQAKTRLAEASSAAWALRVAHALLEDSLDRFGQVLANRTILYTPATAAAFFSLLAQGRYDLIPQCEGDLGQRLHNFFALARAQGYSRIVAIGSDSPTLPTSYIDSAFQLLEEVDVVIGPAFDGGYYLIGCGSKQAPIFADIPWSTGQVLEQTVKRLETTSLRLALLPPWCDIDTTEDWAMVRGHVLATRHAGLDPGVPRLERLILEPTP